MKKIIALSAAAVMMSSAVCAQAASQTKLTVTDGEKRQVSFLNDTTDAAAASVKNVLYTLDDLVAKNAKINQAFDVMCEVEEDGAVDVYLRLAAESSTVDALSASTELLRTYDIVVKDNAGEVIFDSTETELEVSSPVKGEFVADIFLGRFNEEELTEVNTYNLSVTVPSDLTANEIKKAKDIKWEIVSDPVEEGATPAPEAETEDTAEEPVEPTEAPAAPVVTPEPTKAPEATQAPEATEVPEATEEPAAAVSGGERVIGDGEGQIKAGKYTATARDDKAVIKVYDAEGELKKEVELNESRPSYVLTLSDGEKIVYEGGVRLAPYTEQESTSGKIAGSATSAPKGKTTDTKTTATTKTNPKTGDSAPIAGVSVAAVFALGMLAYPEIEKRRKNNN